MIKSSKIHKKSPAEIAVLSVIFIGLLLLVLTLIVPLLWAFMTTFKDPNEYLLFENVLGFPKKIIFGNYKNAFGELSVNVNGYDVGILEMYFYSIVYAFGGSLVQTFVTCIVAYTIAKFPKRFSKILYFFVLVTSSLQIVGSLPSEMQVARFLKIYDNIVLMYIMRCHFLNMYFLFFYASAKMLPKSLFEAAEIDGANEVYCFFKIGLPLMKSIFITVFLLFSIASWNDYQVPMMYLPSYPTISYGIYIFFVSTNTTTSVPKRMAGCMFLLVPMLVLYLIFNKRLLENVAMGGLKE